MVRSNPIREQLAVGFAAIVTGFSDRKTFAEQQRFAEAQPRFKQSGAAYGLKSSTKATSTMAQFSEIYVSAGRTQL